MQDQKVYHYHVDHLGTPQEISNEQGEIVWSVRYRAYGNVVKKEIEQIENNLRFQGQYFDEETGLHYNRFRYYNPTTGRFINQDPIGLLGGMNNYQYVPNPTGWVDPLGLFCKEQINKSVDRNRGRKIILKDGSIEYHFKSRKDAIQAASEILGDMGSQPKKRTIAESYKEPDKLPYRLRESSRIYEVSDSGRTKRYRDDLLGHHYDSRPHLNVEDFKTGENLHFYYEN